MGSSSDFVIVVDQDEVRIGLVEVRVAVRIILAGVDKSLLGLSCSSGGLLDGKQVGIAVRVPRTEVQRRLLGKRGSSHLLGSKKVGIAVGIARAKLVGRAWLSRGGLLSS